jgi:beta-mannosidase
MRHLLLSLLLLTLFSACKKDIVTDVEFAAQIQPLNTEWEMRQADNDDWMPVAKIPSTVHTALLDNKKIEDPFYRNNEAKLQWIETKDWEYRKRFNVPEALLAEEIVELNFKGLDTYADVYLNGQKILEADNMFRSWLVDVKSLLKKDNNELRIHFHSATAKDNEKWAALGYELPDGSKRAVTRKAGFHYGWDWGPRFVTAGPWQPIEIRAWSKALINDVHYRTYPKEGQSTTIQAFFDVDATVAGPAMISVDLDGQHYQKEVPLKIGNNKDSLSFTSNDLKLWWPNGLGEQTLYLITGSLAAADFSDKKEDRIGIREVKLQQEESSDGLSFTFVVNGFPFFAKGANYIPQDIFQDRVTDEKYTTLLGDAKLANMNMLRVWGGGIYENDIFYNTCDEMGIMVWQDFMFANTMVPGDKPFQQNVAEEAKEQVNRLANHPSIALWCGNNEISEGWHRWGWQDGLSEEQKTKTWADYESVFKNILPNAVEESVAGSIPYWESSPQYGRGDANHVYLGDSHYWGIWHDAEPFENFKTKVPRFMSEFGFQSLPSLSTIKTFTIAEDRNMGSEVMKAHQKHSRGTALIKEYMARAYRTPKGFDNFVYVSQLLQADGVKMGMEAHLRRQPYCMGSLYWQLNDCWPVASWSSIDNTGTWKALHYAAKKTFEPIHLSMELRENRISPMAINTTRDTVNILAQIKIQNFNGEVVFTRVTPITVPAMGTKLISGGTVQQVARKTEINEAIVGINLLRTDSSFISGDHIFLVKPKDLNLTKPNISTTMTKTAEGFVIRMETDVLAKSVYLEVAEAGWFDDNYFDLLPGTVKEVLFVPAVEGASLSLEQLGVRSLIDSYE